MENRYLLKDDKLNNFIPVPLSFFGFKAQQYHIACIWLSDWPWHLIPEKWMV